MSATTTPTATPETPSAPTLEPTWAKPTIAVYQLSLFLAAMVLVIWLKNDNALLLLIGAVITKTGTVIDYFFGSSSGSAAKTAMLTPPTPTPGATP